MCSEMCWTLCNCSWRLLDDLLFNARDYQEMTCKQTGAQFIFFYLKIFYGLF